MPIGKITVVNKYIHTPTDNDFYIGRGSPLGNPFKIGEQSIAKHPHVLTREDVIAEYKPYIRNQIDRENQAVLGALNLIGHKCLDGQDVNLVCFCKPRECHGDVIKSIIEAKLQEVHSSGLA